MEKIVHLMFDRETKGAVLYKEVDGPESTRQLDQYTGSIVSQYIRKTAFEGKPPARIQVTLKY